MKLYKLTDDQDSTRERTGWSRTTRWGMGVTHKAKGGGLIRAHHHPLLAVLSYLIENDFANIHLWEADGEPVSDSSLVVESKVIGDIVDEAFGIVKCKELTTLKQINVPWISSDKLVVFAILCALEVYDEPQFVVWANAWLNGKDRTETAAKAAQDIAEAVAKAALDEADAALAAGSDTKTPLSNNHAASAASSAAQAVIMLEYKDDFTVRPDSIGAFGAAFASQRSAQAAVWAARWAALTKWMTDAELIDLLVILERVIE